MAQIDGFLRTIGARERAAFRRQVSAVLLGSRGKDKAVRQVMNED